MTVQIVIASTSDIVLPAGLTFSGYKFEILDSANAVVGTPQTVNALSASFPTPPAGTYTASATAVDQNGNAMSSAATASFAITAPATFPAPATLTVTVS